MMVPKGRTAVVPYEMATVLRIEVTKKRGPVKRITVKRTLFSCKIKWCIRIHKVLQEINNTNPSNHTRACTEKKGGCSDATSG